MENEILDLFTFHDSLIKEIHSISARIKSSSNQANGSEVMTQAINVFELASEAYISRLYTVYDRASNIIKNASSNYDKVFFL